jgi:hypothetical protein
MAFYPATAARRLPPGLLDGLFHLDILKVAGPIKVGNKVSHCGQRTGYAFELDPIPSGFLHRGQPKGFSEAYGVADGLEHLHGARLVALKVSDDLDPAFEPLFFGFERFDFLLQLRQLSSFDLFLLDLLIQIGNLVICVVPIRRKERESQTHRDDKQQQLESAGNSYPAFDAGTGTTEKVDTYHAASKLLSPRPTQTANRGAISRIYSSLNLPGL